MVTAPHTAVYNPGDLPARPIYRIYGTGRMVLYLGPVDRCSHVAVDPAGLERAEPLTCAVIDSDAMTVTDPDTGESLTEITSIHYNGIPGLWIPPHGTVYVDANNPDELGTTTRVVITPRWRWL